MIKNLTAKDIMLCDVTFIEPSDLVAVAKLKMLRANVGGVPVLDGKKLVGLITHRDVLLAGNEAMGLKVEDLMSKNLCTVNVNTSIKKICILMAETGYQRIPVVVDDELVGLITQSCIIRAVAENL
jgi:CBS domain-containing protein